MATVTICSDFGAQENKSLSLSIVSPSICHEMMELDVMIFIFWMLSFKPAFSLFSSTSIERLFSSYSLSAIRVVSSVYEITDISHNNHDSGLCFIQPGISCTMYSAYKLNRLDDNIQPWCTPFPIWNQFIVPCPILTVASKSAYRFLRRQVRWSGNHISFKNFPQFVVTTQRL